MRKVERSAAIPEGLADKMLEEIGKGEGYFPLSAADRKDLKKPEFTAYKLAAVKAELERLFHGKCAYCESRYDYMAPVDVEHYRPKGKVQEEKDHDGYWWLAADWTNLLPSCIDCNRKRRQPTPKPSANLLEMVETGTGTRITSTGKKDSFPLAEGSIRATTAARELTGEKPLLIDPAKDDPNQSLDFAYDPAVGASLVFPTGSRSLNPVGIDITPVEVATAAGDASSDLRGAVSIHVYGLNRLALVQARTRVVRRLIFLETVVDDLDEIIGEIEGLSGVTSQKKDGILSKIELLQDRIIREMADMAKPTAEHSAVAKSWLAEFKERRGI